jgi:Pyrimidine dimer DNA glycosylase
MQTFLPVPNFAEVARILDWRRLGRQRVEARAILTALTKPNGWSNHPAVRMWAGYENALIYYGNEMIITWRLRGYRNRMPILFPDPAKLDSHGCVVFPPWLGDERLHASHRSNLLRKDLLYYSQFGWREDSTLPYFWPGRDA